MDNAYKVILIISAKTRYVILKPVNNEKRLGIENNFIFLINKAE